LKKDTDSGGVGGGVISISSHIEHKTHLRKHEDSGGGLAQHDFRCKTQAVFPKNPILKKINLKIEILKVSSFQEKHRSPNSISAKSCRGKKLKLFCEIW